MKTLTFIIAIFFASFLSAQNTFKWSQPGIITDTNSFYANPYVAVYYYNDNISWLFYEKQEQHSSIYKMNLSNLSDNQLLLGSETVNYRKPLFYVFNNPDFPGLLFYLSDQEGFFNLYAVKLFNNDSLGTPVKVIQNLLNKDITDYSLNFNGEIGYTIDSMVYAAIIKFTTDSVFTEKITLLDSASFNINISNNCATWQKIESDSSHIKNSRHAYHIDSTGFFWGTPGYADSTGDCRWLISSSSTNVVYSNYYCWVKNNSVKGIFGSYPDLDTVIIDTYSKPDVRQISMFKWYIAVKEPIYDPYYLCFTTGLGDSSEIFCSQNPIFSDKEGVYLTNNNYRDDNPKVFLGEIESSSSAGWTMWVYCIWQAHINGKVALAMSKNIADFGYSINENLAVDKFIRVSPNPFHDKLNIKINTSGKKNADLSIYTSGGIRIAGFTPRVSTGEWKNYTWHPSSTTVSAGIYFIVLTLDNRKYVKKVILSY